MKKTYINPKMKVVELKPARLLSASDPVYGGRTTATEGNLAPELSDDFDDFDE